jgi:hypothetical protein
MLQAKSCPVISSIVIYKAPQILDRPSIISNQTGEIIITPVDQGEFSNIKDNPLLMQ